MKPPSEVIGAPTLVEMLPALMMLMAPDAAVSGPPRMTPFDPAVSVTAPPAFVVPLSVISPLATAIEMLTVPAVLPAVEIVTPEFSTKVCSGDDPLALNVPPPVVTLAATVIVPDGVVRSTLTGELVLPVIAWLTLILPLALIVRVGTGPVELDTVIGLATVMMPFCEPGIGGLDGDARAAVERGLDGRDVDFRIVAGRIAHERIAERAARVRRHGRDGEVRERIEQPGAGRAGCPPT